MRHLSFPSESMINIVGVHKASKRWKYAGCSLMWASTGTKVSLMNDETSSSAYDSASSRAQAVHAGAALKSSSKGFFSAFASVSAASTSFFHSTVIKVYLPKIVCGYCHSTDAVQQKPEGRGHIDSPIVGIRANEDAHDHG